MSLQVGIALAAIVLAAQILGLYIFFLIRDRGNKGADTFRSEQGLSNHYNEILEKLVQGEAEERKTTRSLLKSLNRKVEGITNGLEAAVRSYRDQQKIKEN